jgi:hypothetical protein
MAEALVGEHPSDCISEMTGLPSLAADVVILGGGCAGLWLLDDLRRRRVRVLLLETNALGSGQTIASQGILHGGLKYSLGGLLSPWAEAMRGMPAVWQASLRGANEPDLSGVALRSSACHMWRTATLKSWTATLGAVATLKVRPIAISANEEPAVLSGCPRPIYRLDEPVINPRSFLEVMVQRNAGLIWKLDPQQSLQAKRLPGSPESFALRLTHPESGAPLELQTRYVVAMAGAGNEAIRESLGLPGRAVQHRPLRIALVRGNMPALNGHCIEGMVPKLTITSDKDAQGRTIWHLGGLVGETGANMPAADFLRHAQGELAAALPGWQSSGQEWATIRMDRAEGFAADGVLPSDVQIAQEGNVITAWPIKLVLAPRLSTRIQDLLPLEEMESLDPWLRQLDACHWPTPVVARPIWEEETLWTGVL